MNLNSRQRLAHLFFLAIGALCSFPGAAWCSDTDGMYHIENVAVHANAGGLREGAYLRGPKESIVFIPQVQVTLKTAKDLSVKNRYVHAYFYDATGKLIVSDASPAKSSLPGQGRGDGADVNYVLPKIFKAGQIEKAYFPIPDKMPDGWKVVIVFGSSKAAVAAVAPIGDERDFSYLEQKLVQQTALSPVVEEDSDDIASPLIEHVVITDNPSYPKFTLFLHLPHGITNPKDVKGVFAQCMLASSAQSIRDTLNSIAPVNDLRPSYAFAEAHQLAILAWGGHGGANTNLNYADMDKDQLEIADERFQSLADAWDKGVQALAHDYGMPDHDFLLNGWSAAGEWAGRLALHKPDRFLAVHVHVATKYDAPTPEGKRVLWLLTSGELDPGANGAFRFFTDIKQMQYPVVFKSFIGLGHGNSPAVDQLENRFFEYALSLKKPFEAPLDPTIPTPPVAYDLNGFNAAPYYGDGVNQEMFPAMQKDMIPPGFLVPLPNKEIADAWNR